MHLMKTMMTCTLRNALEMRTGNLRNGEYTFHLRSKLLLFARLPNVSTNVKKGTVYITPVEMQVYCTHS